MNNNNNNILNFILMRMKNHFSKMGKALLNVALLSAVGFTSCADDQFHLKDLEENPRHGLSIYHELQNRGEYKTVLKLIEDLDYADVLSKTGSKTLFVANDAAFDEFYKNNPWKVTAYDQLSKNQKRVLLNNAMLNNAYVLEMLANTEGGGKNLCLRQGTSATASDSVARWHVNELPATQSSTDIDWFKYLRDRGDSVYMALDSSDPMMTHFIEGQLKNKSITFADVEKIMGQEWNMQGKKTFGFINDCRIIDGDIVCLNGYIHVLDKVLLAPGNMAEMIRNNSNTKLFSKMLDRFAAPYYNEQLTKQYGALNEINGDSVYEKRYISNRSQGGGISRDPFGESFDARQFYLPFDPGWNQYAVSSSTPKEHDMAAMFVPNDAAMEEYFVRGGGKEMIERYGIADNTKENLETNLYQIPLSLIHPLLENLMKDSFNESVPSKYATVVNDAQDYMFTSSYASVEDFKNSIVECMVANNGIVYVMGKLNAPAEYASVMAPVSLLDDLKVVRAVVKADDNYIEGTKYNEAPLKQYFSTYLKAMQSYFSFFVPTDEGLATYGIVDPAGFARNPYGRSVGGTGTYARYFWTFAYDDSGSKLPITGEIYKFDMRNGHKYIKGGGKNDNKVHSVTITHSDGTTEKLSGSEATDETSSLSPVKRSLLIEMINQHILVHDNPDGVHENNDRQYYLSRSGAPVRLTNKKDTTDMVVEGGYQVMLNDESEGNADNNHVATVVSHYNKTQAKNEYGNGVTYIIDRPIQATMRSVYNHMTYPKSKNPYNAFWKLVDPAQLSDDLLEACGYYKKLNDKGELVAMEDAEKKKEKLKYLVFARETDNAGVLYPSNSEQLVRFFNNYNYTVYIPTADQIKEAQEKGLMTWSDIDKWVSSRTNKYAAPLSEEDQLKARAMITTLVNFVKYHFQDQSVFVDNVTAQGKYQTSCVDNVTDSYLSLEVTQSPSRLSVVDRMGNTVNVVDAEANRNLLARDICYNATYTSAYSIKNSSYAVLHQIDGYLNFNAPEDYDEAMPVGRFDFWNYATPEQIETYVAKYRLR